MTIDMSFKPYELIQTSLEMLEKYLDVCNNYLLPSEKKASHEHLLLVVKDNDM